MSLARTYKIETTRLIIRCYQPSDAPKLLEAVTQSKEHLLPWMPWAKAETGSLQTKINLIRQFRGKFDLGEDYTFGIFNKSETELIGSTGLHTRAGTNGREIGYWINVKHLNKGLATEAVMAVTKVGFEIETLNNLFIHCDPSNTRSSNIPQKLGFKHKTTMKNQTHDALDQPRDTMVWSMMKPDYELNPIKQFPLQAYDITGEKISI